MPFASFPSVVVYDDDKKTKIQHLLFGDWVKIASRGVTGWIKKNEIEKDRILQVNFVDIGQGDACFVVTSDDEFIVIDAGKTDNMVRFLSWRFNLRRRNEGAPPISFDSGIISHPDSDHYQGFKNLFEETKISFSNIYHNGIVERAGGPTLGDTIKLNNRKYLSDVVKDNNDLGQILNDNTKTHRKAYPQTLLVEWGENPRPVFQMLGKDQKYVPGYDTGNPKLQIEVLGPVTEKHNGKDLLKYFKNNGKTKNGHSVVLRLKIGELRILLGGDLNKPAEDYLMKQYTGVDLNSLRNRLNKADTPEKRAEIQDKIDDAITMARKYFECEIAKACHHGSPDLTTEFLKAVNPIATIISSGDDEPYSHPRPDALGVIGKYGRGERPLIFSTELARSTKENIKWPEELRKKIRRLVLKYDRLPDGDPQKVKVKTKIDNLLDTIERSIAIYGMINIRTDGERTIIAQKLERPRNKGSKYDIHQIVEKNGEFHYVSKH